MKIFDNRGPEEIRRWFERARKGDARSWDALVDQFQNLVYSIARRNGLDANDASDVFQVTFLALYRNLDRVDNPDTLAKWLAVTAAREALKLKRMSARYVHEQEDGPALEETLADEEDSAERQAVDATEAEYWRAAVKRLGGKCEQLLAALYFDESSYDDITASLGIPMGAIGPTRARCLEKLKKMYQTEHKETLE